MTVRVVPWPGHTSAQITCQGELGYIPFHGARLVQVSSSKYGGLSSEQSGAISCYIAHNLSIYPKGTEKGTVLGLS